MIQLVEVLASDGRTYGKIRDSSAKQGNAVARKQRNWNALVPEDDIFNSQDGSMGAEQGLFTHAAFRPL